jgi:hypothetical protein
MSEPALAIQTQSLRKVYPAPRTPAPSANGVRATPGDTSPPRSMPSGVVALQEPSLETFERRAIG